MVGVGVFISAGVMCIVSAYFLFQLAKREEEDVTHDALQIIFFFMVIASLLILGHAGYIDRLDCNQLLMNSTVVNDTTINAYSYVCEDAGTRGLLWLYKLPLFLAEIAGLYLLIYYFQMVLKFIRNKKRGRE